MAKIDTHSTHKQLLAALYSTVSPLAIGLYYRPFSESKLR